jgi:hypothetical protein
MSINPSIFISPFVSILTGKIILAGTADSPAKIVARAEEIIAINTAIVEINSGNSAGVTALQSALTTTTLDPGVALALQSLFAGIANQLSILSNLAGSTLLGQANTVILDSILTIATTAAQAYVQKYGASAPAPAPAAA